MTHDSSQSILKLTGISKEFGHVRALNNVAFDVREGEILDLVGDNGAGKSTLIKIASGVYQPNAGQIQIDDQPVTFANPHVARDHGIATVYQDLALADDRDLASNLFLGREPTRFFMVDKQRMNRESRQILNRLRSNIPSVKTMVGFLSGGQRQAVAIGRAVSQGGRIFILDEPTAALGVRESANVLRLITELRDHGSSVGGRDQPQPEPRLLDCRSDHCPASWSKCGNLSEIRKLCGRNREDDHWSGSVGRG